MKKFLILFIILITSYEGVYSQVTIGSSSPPNENALLDFNENGDGSSTKGILFPRVTLLSLDNPSPMKEHIEGMVVYNTATSEETIDEKAAVSPGYYFNNGTNWIRMSTSDSNPWSNSVTQAPASTIEEPMYHLGALATGTVQVDPSAQVQVSSGSKGVLIPRMTLNARDAITNPANGLIIFNTTSNCINYYNQDNSRWLNLCGGYDPANIDILCDRSSGSVGFYKEGTGLNTSNTYTIKINARTIGTYEIVAYSNNGYTFAKSGLLTSTGNFDIVLEGQGTPTKEGVDNLVIQNNGIFLTLDCSLPTVTVDPASIRYSIVPNSAVVYGDYLIGVPLNTSNYIEIEVNVTVDGILNIESETENGVAFSSGSISLDRGVQKVKLYGRGTPTLSGVFQGNTISHDNVVLIPSITVINTKGTFENPVDRCQEILDESLSTESGYFWVKDTEGNRFMTYCLIEDGNAWTLIKSLSENQIINIDRTQAESFATQPSRNVVTQKNGVFNEYAFSLPSSTVNNVGSSVASTRMYKFTIKEKGHTTAEGATMDDVIKTTVSPLNDQWAQENYWNVTITSGNPATTNFNGNGANNSTYGKLFGKVLERPSVARNIYYFDGVQFRTTVYGMYSQANFFTGFYGTAGAVATNTAANNVIYTYHDRGDENDGKTFTYNKYDINDLFGVYLGSEPQLNHHIGTCRNSTDDFGGASSCASGFANWRPHNFNQRPNGTYEGRIIQYWVK